MHLAPLVRDLAIILAVAGGVTLLFQKIRQPVVLGYIVAGLIVGPHMPPYILVSDVPNVKILAELGVIFLMFSLGLEFSFRKLARVGVTAAFTALFEVSSMIVIGFMAGKMLGWPKIDSVFLGAMLAISSTTIIIKALDELGLKSRRFAEFVFGILIVEDLYAILLLVTLTTFASEGALSTLNIAHSLGRLVLIVGSWFLAGYFVVPRFVRYVGSFHSDEMLSVVAIGLCLGMSSIAGYFHYPPALGAFIMGSILAESSESYRIEEVLRPVRDIFAAIFFVSVGMLIDPAIIWKDKGIIALLSIIVILGKLINASIGPALTGQPLKTSILIGFSLGQIGEFSFIIASLGIALGAMNPEIYPIIVAVSLLTTFTTPYLIRNAPFFAEKFERSLPHRLRVALDAFSTWRNTQPNWILSDRELKTLLFKWIANAFIVILIHVSMIEYGIVLLRKLSVSNPWIHPLAWILSLVLSAPCIASMMKMAQSRKNHSLPRPSLAPILSQITTSGLLAVLSLFFFNALYVGIALAFLSLFIFRKNIKQLELAYRWMEEGLLSTFKQQQKTKPRQNIQRQLAPWDEHLVRIKVHADSDIAGKRISDAQLRNRFGVNIVAIRRGSRVIVAPKPDQQIFPKDELLFLGNDEQIEKFRNSIESPGAIVHHEISIEEYEVRRLLITSSSMLLGKSIRNSGIRERFNAMVVGVERKNERLMNPDSDLMIEADDVLSVVGESSQLDQLTKTI